MKPRELCCIAAGSLKKRSLVRKGGQRQQIARVRLGAEPARGAWRCRDQPQHATRTLTVGDPIKVKAGFDFSAAASRASSAISKARRSSPPGSGALIPSFILPFPFCSPALPPASKGHHSKRTFARKIGVVRCLPWRDRRLSATARRDTIRPMICSRFTHG
jgi:hypothetical protein